MPMNITSYTLKTVYVSVYKADTFPNNDVRFEIIRFAVIQYSPLLNISGTVGPKVNHAILAGTILIVYVLLLECT